MIFVDSGGWIAGFYSADQHHLAASRWFRQNNQLLLTTDYIVDEALTLLKARGKPRLALKLGERFFSGDLAQIHYLTEDDIQPPGRSSVPTRTRCGASRTAQAKS